MSSKFKFLVPDSLKYEPIDGRADDSSLDHQLHALLGTHCPTNVEKYQILKRRDDLLCKLRVRNTDVNAAKVVAGTCPDMCPEKERYMRDTQKNLNRYECDERGTMIPEKTVKDYSRSAADQEEPLPHELRSTNVLQMTMNYLITRLEMPSSNSDLTKWYDFLWSRTRSIRKDITQQMLNDPHAADLVEKCARFHIFASFRLSHLEESEFSQKMNTENLSKSFQTLRHMYDDMAREGRFCENEAEFRSYDTLLNLADFNVHSQVLSYRPEVYTSPSVQLALELASAFQSNNYVKFFRLLRERASVLQACLCYRYFPSARYSALKTIVQAYRVLPISFIENTLAFDDSVDTQRFLSAFGFEIDASDASIDARDGRAKLFQSDINPETLSVGGCGWIDEKISVLSLPEILCNEKHVRLEIATPINSFDAQNRYVRDPVNPFTFSGPFSSNDSARLDAARLNVNLKSGTQPPLTNNSHQLHPRSNPSLLGFGAKSPSPSISQQQQSQMLGVAGGASDGVSYAAIVRKRPASKTSSVFDDLSKPSTQFNNSTFSSNGFSSMFKFKPTEREQPPAMPLSAASGPPIEKRRLTTTIAPVFDDLSKPPTQVNTSTSYPFSSNGFSSTFKFKPTEREQPPPMPLSAASGPPMEKLHATTTIAPVFDDLSKLPTQVNNTSTSCPFSSNGFSSTFKFKPTEREQPPPMPLSVASGPPMEKLHATTTIAMVVTAAPSESCRVSLTPPTNSTLPCSESQNPDELKKYYDALKEAAVYFVAETTEELADSTIDLQVESIANSVYEAAKYTQTRLTSIYENLHKLWLRQFVDRWMDLVRHKRRIKDVKFPKIGTSTIKMRLSDDKEPFARVSSHVSKHISAEQLELHFLARDFRSVRGAHLERTYFDKWRQFVERRRAKHYVDSFFPPSLPSGFGAHLYNRQDLRNTTSSFSERNLVTPVAEMYHRHLTSTPFLSAQMRSSPQNQNVHEYFRRQPFSPI